MRARIWNGIHYLGFDLKDIQIILDDYDDTTMARLVSLLLAHKGDLQHLMKRMDDLVSDLENLKQSLEKKESKLKLDLQVIAEMIKGMRYEKN